jgi:asparaginyl-tRNA synthetase
MELVTVRELFKNREQYLDKKVTVGGWIRSIRDSKTFGFIVVNDGSYFEPLQVVYHDKMENFDEISRQNVGAAIIVTGTLVATPQAKQPFEIQADEVTVEGASAPDYPLQKKRHSFEYLRTISHLRPRTNIPGRISSTFHDRICDPPVLPGERICVCTHTTDHRK